MLRLDALCMVHYALGMVSEVLATTGDEMKESLFTTAQVSKHVFTHNGENDLREGDIVAVSYIGHKRNQLFRRDEAVYAITANGQFWGHLYANALDRFVI